MTLLDFYADWCGPCQKMAPVIESLAADHPDLRIIKVDIDAAPDLAQEYAVSSVPTFVMLDSDDEIAARVSGAMPKAVLKTKLGLA